MISFYLKIFSLFPVWFKTSNCLDGPFLFKKKAFWMMQPLQPFHAILKSIFIQIFHFWNHLAYRCRQSAYCTWQHWNSLPTNLCPRKEKSFGTSEPNTFCTASSCSICYTMPLHCYVILWLLTGPYVNYFALNSLRDLILIKGSKKSYNCHQHWESEKSYCSSGANH